MDQNYTVTYWNAVHTGQRSFETMQGMIAFLAKVQNAGYKVQHTPLPGQEYQELIRKALRDLAEQRGDV